MAACRTVTQRLSSSHQPGHSENLLGQGTLPSQKVQTRKETMPSHSQGLQSLVQPHLMPCRAQVLFEEDLPQHLWPACTSCPSSALLAPAVGYASGAGAASPCTGMHWLIAFLTPVPSQVWARVFPGSLQMKAKAHQAVFIPPCPSKFSTAFSKACVYWSGLYVLC